MPRKLIVGLIGTLALTILALVCVRNSDSVNLWKQDPADPWDGSEGDAEISSYPLYENHPHDTFAQFLNFIAKYGKDKEYNSEEEFKKRLGIFRSNYDRIVKYNRMDDAGFTLEINKFADLDDDEFVKKHATGVIISEERRKRVEQ